MPPRRYSRGWERGSERGAVVLEAPVTFFVSPWGLTLGATVVGLTVRPPDVETGGQCHRPLEGGQER